MYDFTKSLKLPLPSESRDKTLPFLSFSFRLFKYFGNIAFNSFDALIWSSVILPVTYVLSTLKSVDWVILRLLYSLIPLNSHSYAISAFSKLVIGQ